MISYIITLVLKRSLIPLPLASWPGVVHFLTVLLILTGGRITGIGFERPAVFVRLFLWYGVPRTGNKILSCDRFNSLKLYPH